MLDQAQPDVLIVDQRVFTGASAAILGQFSGRILLANGETTSAHGEQIDGLERLSAVESLLEPISVAATDEAYLVFTSGTTGAPNGVAISAGNLAFAVSAIVKQYPLTSSDRFSQFFDLSFDFSVMDLFVPWRVGASTYVIPETQKMGPGRFIIDHQLSVWTSVPSLVSMMSRMKMLKPGLFESLRLSFFGGELLSHEAAEQWQKATPAGQVINLYGQTEAPIGSLFQTFGVGESVTDETGGVALGGPLAGIYAEILDRSGAFVEGESVGELAISGAHVASGYLDNPRQTGKKFRVIEHPCHGERNWYLTGDLVRRDRAGFFHFLGRVDNELKIKGYRVSLEEVEHFLRQCSGCDSVAVIPIRSELGDIEALRGFIVAERCNEQKLKTSLRQSLPQPLVPKRIHPLRELPLSHNGKIDRESLALLSVALD
jgi:acyl-coenzyme A synthetase/AMP-(fatty) acid ligase